MNELVWLKSNKSRLCEQHLRLGDHFAQRRAGIFFALDVLVPNELSSTVSYWMNPGKQIFEKQEALSRRVHAAIR